MNGAATPADARVPSPRRLFVALWPEPATRTQLDALSARLLRAHPGSRRLAPESLHATLAFIGALDDAHAGAVHERLAALPTPEGSWQLDHLGHFHGPRVLWVGGTACPPLLALVESVRSALLAEAVPFDDRAFVGHVTLLRDVRRPRLGGIAAPAIPWPLTRPALVVSARDAECRLRYTDWRPVTAA